jgi:hypothetical protein
MILIIFWIRFELFMKETNFNLFIKFLSFGYFVLY